MSPAQHFSARLRYCDRTDHADPDTVRALATRASQRVGQLGRFHKTQAEHLKNRIGVVREALPQLFVESITTYPKGYKANITSIVPDDGLAPWD